MQVEGGQIFVLKRRQAIFDGRGQARTRKEGSAAPSHTPMYDSLNY